MANALANKCILLCVTGSIAAYKSADLIRRLREMGAIVHVAMTENAKQFITPLTMQALSGFPVHDDLFDKAAEAAMGHIELARLADLVLVAPASADFMAHLASGLAGDLISTLCLATRAPIVLAPAMNQGMWQHSLTQANLQVLKQNSVHILPPGEGSQACGDIGPGRMMEPLQIIEKLNAFFATGSLAKVRMLITAGPTHEAIDPIRFIGNKSSGKMGYALAEAAVLAGAEVSLISGPVCLSSPSQLIDFTSVESADEMLLAVMKRIMDCDIFVSVAAVGDYRLEKVSKQKIHKDEAPLLLKLVPTIDIVTRVSSLTPKPFIVGFAAETEDLLARAKMKRTNKKMDMIIANQVGLNLSMGGDENEVCVITEQQEHFIARMPKSQLARQLIKLIAEEFMQQTRRKKEETS